MSKRSMPDAAALAPVLRAGGSDAFGDALLAWLAPAVGAAHVSAFRFDAGLSARVVLAAGDQGGRVARRSSALYLGSGLYRHDRLRGVLAAHSGPGMPAAPDAHPEGRTPALRADRSAASGEGPLLLRTCRADIGGGAYGAQLWDRFGLVDRVSLLGLLGGQWTALNLYRQQAQGPFTADDLRRLARLGPMLMALLEQHLSLLRPAGALASAQALPLSPEAAAALLQRLPVRLSAREREVCAFTLAGHSRPGIALALGIAHSSVATLRTRAWRKLGIHTSAELFALCLQASESLPRSATGAAHVP